ncbi:hypothetical protein HTZ84_21140 [Haloterrigena sp. SYSU A558-1]|uniref:Uncharacterized protein n=1 Tax=Haloterrigena gelatinilytica TaxID=2741724 RepID=A0ABX2LGE4_9EURY|nr:hypothetical protein [Haloterrigena gelatinilytica]NUC74771.1 hypothetical protein [Haloterrigena gelatinilytica]
MGKRPEIGAFAEEVEDFHANPDDLDYFDPHLVLGYFQRLEMILEKCPVNIYAASSLKHPWPYRLQKAGECAPASFWRSQHRILDSNITDPTVTNEDILAEAVTKDATAVVAKDYLPFHLYDRKFDLEELTGAANHTEATTQSIREFIDLHDPDRHPPAYIPLQPPYVDHIQDIREIVVDSHLEERYMLGGLKNANPKRRISEAQALRDEIGDEPDLHGLGWGLSDSLVESLRHNPDLIESVDNSGPSQAILNGGLLDKHWQKQPFGLVEGQMRNSVAGAFEFGILLQATHRLTKYNTEFTTKQKSISDYQ